VNVIYDSHGKFRIVIKQWLPKVIKNINFHHVINIDLITKK
jgi:hypothetical protein